MRWLKQASNRYLLAFVIVFAFAGSILLVITHATVSMKTPIVGLLDRGGLGDSSYSLPNNSDAAGLNGVVANVSWAQLQTTQGGSITSANQLNSVLTKVAAYNRTNSANLEVKVRIFSGIYAPNWAKQIDGWNPVNICNSQRGGGNCGTIGPFWTTDYDNAYRAFMTRLAGTTDSLGNTFDNEPLLHDVTISQCMTTYAETFQRDDTNFGQVLYPTPNLHAAQPNYTGLAYSPSNDENCLMDQVDNATGWKHTHLSLSFNPYKPWTNASTQSSSPGESFTLSVMQHCRSVLGNQCTIENNSIRDSYIGQQNTSGNLYYDIKHQGPDITFQTASNNPNNGVGNLAQTVQWAALMGANSVELPGGYNGLLNLSQMAALSTTLLANPTH